MSHLDHRCESGQIPFLPFVGRFTPRGSHPESPIRENRSSLLAFTILNNGLWTGIHKAGPPCQHQIVHAEASYTQ